MPAGFGGYVCPTTSTHSLTHTHDRWLSGPPFIQSKISAQFGKAINKLIVHPHILQSEIEIVGRAVWNTAPDIWKKKTTRGRRVGQRRRRTRSLSMWHTLKRSQTKRRNFDGAEQAIE